VADSALTLMMMVLNDPLPDLRKVREDIPDSLQAVVEKALAKLQTERFQSMAEMAVALRRVEAELARTPSTPSATLVDEPEGKRVVPSTIVDSPLRKASQESHR
jgi:hypothetical protein